MCIQRDSEWCRWDVVFTTSAFPVRKRGVNNGASAGGHATHLLLLPKGKKTDTGYFHDFESHTGNITLGLATTTETRNKDFIVLVDKVQTTIVLERRQLEAPETGLNDDNLRARRR